MKQFHRYFKIKLNILIKRKRGGRQKLTGPLRESGNTFRGLSWKNPLERKEILGNVIKASSRGAGSTF